MDRNDGFIRWSQNAKRSTFITIDLSDRRAVQLYNATGAALPDQFDVEKVTKNTNFPQLTCYDWSPVVNGLVAVGTTRGEVHLLRVDDDSNASIILPLKLVRQCQSVAFNNRGLLAVGLDRVRNDQCLQIWDVNERLTGWDPSQKGWAGVSETSTEPLRKLEPSLSITSARFFEDQPQTLVVGIKNQSVRINDLRDPSGAVLSFQTRCNNNLAIDFANPNYFASSSLDQPSIVIWDRRASSRSAASLNYLHSVEENEVPWGGVLKLDRVIETGDAGSQIRNLRYCRDKPSSLGVLSSSGELRVLDLAKRYEEPSPAGQAEGGPELLEVCTSRHLEYAYFHEYHKTTSKRANRVVSFDWMTLGSADYQSRLVTLRANASLDVFLMPSPSARLFGELLNFSGPARFSNKELPSFADSREAERVLGPIYKAQQLLEAQFSPTSNIKLFDRTSKIGPALSTNFGVTRSLNQTSNGVGNGQEKGIQPNHLAADEIKSLSNAMESSNLLRSNIIIDSQQETEGLHSSSTVLQDSRLIMRQTYIKRIRKGYLFDCKKNADIVVDSPSLSEMWKWLAEAEKASKDDGMVSGFLDLSYLGICAIWQNKLGAKPKSRLIEINENPSRSMWERIIGDINRRAGRLSELRVKTSWPQHRLLCLVMTSWGKVEFNLEKALAAMENKGYHTKAAAWALFQHLPGRAVEILRRGGRDLLFMAMALELHHKGGTALNKDDWDNSLKNLPIMEEDPYLRAIYALITTGNFTSIANEKGLPLSDRADIALQNFDDDQLTTWLEQQMESTTRSGDLEGIVLAGISDDTMDVFERYIDLSGDLQTPVLAMSFCAPRYVGDLRFAHWREAYRRFLNRNKLFVDRCRYDVRSVRLSRQRDGTTVLKPPPRQVTVRCVHCDNDLSNDLERVRRDESAGSSTTTTTTTTTTANTTTTALATAGSAVEPGAGPSTSALAPPIAVPSAPATSATATNATHTASSSLPPAPPSAPVSLPAAAAATSTTSMPNPLMPSGGYAGICCSKCGRHLPRCAVCMQHLGMPRSGRPELNTEASGAPGPKGTGSMARFFSFCLRCRHACHADHSMLWFRRHIECPDPECHCECNREDNAGLA